MKLKVTWQIFESIIKSNPIFKDIKPIESGLFKILGMKSKRGSLAMPKKSDEGNETGQGTDLISIVVRKLSI